MSEENAPKYKLTDNTKVINAVILHQIVALKDVDDIEAGFLGGWVESEQNLSQEGNCWIYSGASVYGEARVMGNAKVFGSGVLKGDVKVF